MYNIVILSRKGGTGKTTLADELAFSLERTSTPFCFYDLDPQHDALHDGHEDETAEIAIVDTPGFFMDDIEDTIQKADLLVIPTRAARSDQKELQELRGMISQIAPNTPVIIVQNAWNRFRLCRQFAEWLENDLREVEQVTTVNQSEIIGNSGMMEKSAYELASRNAKIRTQLKTALNMIRTAAGLEEE